MSKLMQPLRAEHAELLPAVEALRATADAVGVVPIPELRRHVAEAHEFLAHHLLPHAAVEEAVLYPAVEQVMGCPDATATMRRDHLEIERLTRDLASIHTDCPTATRCPTRRSARSGGSSTASTPSSTSTSPRRRRLSFPRLSGYDREADQSSSLA